MNMNNEITYTREQAIEAHVSATIYIARNFAWIAEQNNLTASVAAELDKAVVEMVFNPQTDVDRSRIMQIAVDERDNVWTAYDHDSRLGVLKAFYESARARRYVENHGEPLYLRMKGRSNRIAAAFAQAYGEQPFGIRDIWYQFDWTNLKTVEAATRFAINFKDETEVE